MESYANDLGLGPLSVDTVEGYPKLMAVVVCMGRGKPS